MGLSGNGHDQAQLHGATGRLRVYGKTRCKFVLYIVYYISKNETSEQPKNSVARKDARESSASKAKSRSEFQL